MIIKSNLKANRILLVSVLIFLLSIIIDDGSTFFIFLNYEHGAIYKQYTYKGEYIEDITLTENNKNFKGAIELYGIGAFYPRNWIRYSIIPYAKAVVYSTALFILPMYLFFRIRSKKELLQVVYLAISFAFVMLAIAKIAVGINNLALLLELSRYILIKS